MIDNDIAIIFGRVLDPIGAWGLGIVDVESESDAIALGTNDPAVKEAGLAFEVYLMPGSIMRK